MQLQASRAVGRAHEFTTRSWNASRLAPTGLWPTRAPRANEDSLRDVDWNASLASLPQFETKGRRIVRMSGVQEQATDVERGQTVNAERPRLSVVVPVRNEAGNVGPLVAEIAASLAEKAPFEVVYVDDGSTDEHRGRNRPSDGGAGRGCVMSGMRSPAGSRRRSAPASPRARARLSSRSTATARTIRPSCRRWSTRSTQSDRASGSSPASASAARRPASRSCSRASPTGVRGARAARRHPRHRLRAESVPPRRVSGACPISTGCTVSCRPWCGGRATRSPISTWSIGRVSAGTSNYGMWDRLWIGILDLAGVWWLIRRRARVPQVVEVVRNAD